MNKTAFITGIAGQDGSYLAELLLSKGYTVHGLIRRLIPSNIENIKHIRDRLTLHVGQLQDVGNLTCLFKLIKPHEVYNLAAHTFVGSSFDNPIHTGQVTGLGAVNVLEAIKGAGLINHTKFYQASSSEMFGKVATNIQNEKTPFYPRSPYGCAKLYAHSMTINYRESYNMFACCGILFNHESPRRGPEFVTRKLSMAAAKAYHDELDILYMGYLSSKRDWGHAKDYVKAMWLMLQHDEPDDFVIATGKTHTVADFAHAAFNTLGRNFNNYYKLDKKFTRPSEVDLLCGDSYKAKKVLGWEPEYSFEQLVSEMVHSDLKEMEKGAVFNL